MQAKVTAHKGYLILELLATESIPDKVATSLDNPSNFGQVIMNSKENLGMSKEAFELVKTIKRGSDSIGDVDWWKCDNGDFAFSWFGGTHALKKADICATSRQFSVGGFVEIPNDSPEGAIQAVEEIVANTQ